jgi:hypothetical protein
MTSELYVRALQDKMAWLASSGLRVILVAGAILVAALALGAT